MAEFKSTEYTAQLAALSNGAALADGNKTAETLLMTRIQYTLAGTEDEATPDTIGLWLAPAGATIIPALSSIYCADPGTVLTGTIGTVADVDAYSSLLTLDAGGLFRFVPTTPPTELTEATLINMRIGTGTTVTAAVVLYVNIAYTVRH